MLFLKIMGIIFFICGIVCVGMGVYTFRFIHYIIGTIVIIIGIGILICSTILIIG